MDLRDPISSASHLITAVWAVFATLVMWRMSGGRPGRRGPLVVYGVSMVLLYLASGTFHGLHYSTPEQRRVFQQLDQSAVYVLIAGTATPILSILLTGPWRKWFLRMIWALAFAGVACMWLLPKAPHELMVGLYLGLGWLTILPIPLLYKAVGWRAMNWIWVGAALFSAGAICELTKWPIISISPRIGFHEVLHLCDSAGSLAFFLFVIRYVIPYQPRRPDDSAPAHAPQAQSAGFSFPSVVNR
jgi:hemolysin III